MWDRLKPLKIIQLVVVSVILLFSLFTLVVSFLDACGIDSGLRSAFGVFSEQISILFSYLFGFGAISRFICVLILNVLIGWLLFVAIRSLCGKTNREIWSLITFGASILLAGFAFVSLLYLIYVKEFVIATIGAAVLFIIFTLTTIKEFRSVLRKG